MAETARREVLEETGHTITEPELLHEYHPMNGIAAGTAHIFRCRALDRDGDEIADVRWFTRDEVNGMIDSREITDGFSLVALLMHLR